MDNKILQRENYSLGLSGSGIGVWWIKKVDDNFIFFHTDSKETSRIIDINDIPPLLVFSKDWKQSYNSLVKHGGEFKIKLQSAIECNKGILSGRVDRCTKRVPWLDKEDNIIWMNDQIYVLDKDKDGTVTTVMGVTINESERQYRRDMYQTIEDGNIKLRVANKRAIELSKLLVWSMNYDEHPNGDLYFANETYSTTLGMNRTESGLLSFDDFLKTTYPDAEGQETMRQLTTEFEQCLKGDKDEFLVKVVKHQNLLTGAPRFLEHHTTIDERNPDNSMKKIGGYIIDITEKITIERENEALDRKNKDLMLAQKLALTSGKVMVWFMNSEGKYKKDKFYGNDLLFEKLGMEKSEDSTFIIHEFNSTIFDQDEEGAALKKAYFLQDDEIDANRAQSYEKILVKHQSLKTNEIFYFEHNFVVEERYPDGRLKIRGGFMNDVTNETLYKKRIEFLVGHDVVTGLNNRKMFEDYIRKDLPKQYTLLIFDIDGLKFINDAYGHLKGDEIIMAMGDYLKAVFSVDSLCFRIGGDEFAVISKTTDSDIIDKRIGRVKELVSIFSRTSYMAFSTSVGYEIVVDQKMNFTKVFSIAENIMYRRKLGDRNSRKSKTMGTVLETLNSKTEETKAHCDRLGKYAVMILKELGYTRVNELEDIQLLCRVHDIGKITISEAILSKQGKLTTEEYNKMKQHSEAGYKIVKNIVDSDKIANAVLYHHERHDGQGYPFNLKEDEIPLYAKILSVCDSYDVMITGRVYQKAKTKEAAMEEVMRCSGTQFDPKIVTHFINALNKE